MTREENVKIFEKALSDIKREGMDKLLNYLRKSDFYTAPASSRYHLCCEGGLLQHSLNVADCLIAKVEQPTWKEVLSKYERESLILSALLHDICKTNYYTPEYKNKKVYKENGSKHDEGGNYDWETVQAYRVNDKHPLGHGEKSVIMLQQFIPLKPAELYAIRYHMLFTEPKELYSSIGEAIKKYPLVLAISEADLESTYLLEKEV